MADVAGRTDCHCHLLPGLDDGAQTPAESLRLARRLAAWGFRRVVCTPHIAYRYRNTPQTIRTACERLQRALREEAVPLETVPSAEYRLIPETWPEVVRRGWFLPWDGDRLLVELPIRSRVFLGDLDPLREFARLRDAGFVPVLAHPERYGYLRYGELQAFCRAGVLLQVNYPSLCGKYGEEVRLRARELLAQGLVAYFGTDLHAEADAELLDRCFR